MDNQELEIMDDLFGEPDDPGNISQTEDVENVDPLPNDKTAEVIKPKRVVRNPQPKLDAQRLMGPRGIGILPGIFKDVTFKGKGHEKQDLDVLMKKMEHWAHRLFPKLTFNDMVSGLEKLGTKKPVQTMLKRVRMDTFEIYQPDEVEDTVERGNQVVEDDVFDEIFNQQNPRVPTPESSTSQPLQEHTNTVVLSQSNHPKTLTAEQIERMERNKRLALERKKAKELERTIALSQNTANTDIPDSTELEALFTEDDIMDQL